MKDKRSVLDKRKQLLLEERGLVAALEKETAELESGIHKSLRTMTVIGTGVLAAVALYKLFKTGKPGQLRNKARQGKNKVANGDPSAVTASVISVALQKLLPLAIEKISTLNSKGQKHEKAAGSTSK